MIRGEDAKFSLRLLYEQQDIKIAELEATIQVLADRQNTCPPEPIECRRKIDTPSDTYESCVQCRLEDATKEARLRAKE